MSITLYFAVLAVVYVLLRLREVWVARRRRRAAAAGVERAGAGVRIEVALWGGGDYEVLWFLRSPAVTIRFGTPEGPVSLTVEDQPTREDALAAAAILLRRARLAEERAARDRAGSPEDGTVPDEPPQATGEPWRDTLGLGPSDGLREAEAAWRALARRHHPDVGGSAEAMAAINRARDEARSALA